MTPERLTEIRARLERDAREVGEGDYDPAVLYADGWAEPTAELFARAPSDLRELLDEVERLQRVPAPDRYVAPEAVVHWHLDRLEQAGTPVVAAAVIERATDEQLIGELARRGRWAIEQPTGQPIDRGPTAEDVLGELSTWVIRQRDAAERDVDETTTLQEGTEVTAAREARVAAYQAVLREIAHRTVELRAGGGR